MSEQYISKYTGQEIDNLLDKASTSVQPDGAKQLSTYDFDAGYKGLLDRLQITQDGKLLFDNKELAFVETTTEDPTEPVLEE